MTVSLNCCDSDTIAVAVPGIAGPPGPPGSPGSGGSGASYLFTQQSPDAVWTIEHNLGQAVVECAAVYSLDYGVQLYNVIVEPLDANSCRLYFADPVSGYALIQR